METCSTSCSWVISTHQLLNCLDQYCCSHTCSQPYTHSSPWHYGHMGLPSCSGCCTQIPLHIKKRDLPPREGLGKKFIRGTDRWSVAGQGQTRVQTKLCEMISSNPLISLLFSHSCSSPKSPEHPPFLTIDSCPKRPVNPEWSQTPFPLHPAMCPTPEQQFLLAWKMFFQDCSPWHSFAVFMPGHWDWCLSWESTRRSLEKLIVLKSWSLVFPPVPVNYRQVLMGGWSL